MPSDGGFRIRQLFNVSTARYHASNRAYDAHLRRLAPPRPNDAWRFFALDFFHDGPIRQFRVADTGRSLTFEIQATWISLREARLRNQRLAPWFRVEVDGIALLKRWVQPLTGFGDPFRGPEEMYLYAELDTLGPELRRLGRVYPGRRFHSLVMALDPTPAFLTIIYQRLRVRPLAPRGWAPLRRNRHLRIGLYRGPHDLAAP